MILIFVVLVSIILMNLLVGLAVSDIQGLQKSAGLDRLVRQTELISHIESMLFSRLLHFLPGKFLEALHMKALVVPRGYSWAFTIRPNDLREDRLPRDITEGIHWLVSTRHRSRKRRPFSRYAARHRINSVYRDKSFSAGVNSACADSSALEEKLEVLADLKIQMRGLTNDNEEIKQTQEEVNTTLLNMNHHMTSMAEAIERLSGTGRTDLMRRVSRASRRTTPTATPTTVPKNRKTSIDSAVKHLTDLAVTISAEDASTDTTPTNPTRIIPLKDKKLKRTNLMKRRESQALLEGVRKNRHNS